MASAHPNQPRPNQPVRQHQNPQVVAGAGALVAPHLAQDVPSKDAGISSVAKEEPPTRTPVDDEALWPAILEAVRERRRFISSWVEAGALLRINGGTCFIGFPKDQALALESLMRTANRTFIEEPSVGDRRKTSHDPLRTKGRPCRGSSNREKRTFAA